MVMMSDDDDDGGSRVGPNDVHEPQVPPGWVQGGGSKRRPRIPSSPSSREAMMMMMMMEKEKEKEKEEKERQRKNRTFTKG